MRFAVLLLCFFLFALLGGAFPARGGGETVIFRTPVFIALCALICLSIVVCARNVRWRWRNLGFFLSHLGVLVVFLGAFLGFLFEKNTYFAAPVGATYQADVLPGAKENENYQLDFSLGVADFNVDFFPPKYSLYQAPDNPGEEYTLIRDVQWQESGELELPEFPEMKNEYLQDATGNWVRQYVLPGGELLQFGGQTARHYEATLRLESEKEGVVIQRLAVNHPVSFHGWRFYLMDYDHERRQYVKLTARHDPGRGIVIVGIWMLIVGVAWICWRPRRAGHEC